MADRPALEEDVVTPPSPGLTRLAVSATLHCLTGCAIGEVLGLVIGTALGWSDLATIVLAVALAFVFGYALTIRPVLRSGLALSAAIPVALATDTVSITVMEIVDNAVMLLIPSAMEAGLTSPLFWGSLAFALAVAFVVTVPVNRYLIARGRGHAVAPRSPRQPRSQPGLAPSVPPTSAAELRRRQTIHYRDSPASLGLSRRTAPGRSLRACGCRG